MLTEPLVISADPCWYIVLIVLYLVELSLTTLSFGQSVFVSYGTQMEIINIDNVGTKCWHCQLKLTLEGAMID